MKVVAIIERRYSSYDSRFLVEMTGKEFAYMSGVNVDKVQVGSDADPIKLLQLLANVRESMRSAERSAGSFRALADLIDQCVEQAKVAVTDEAKPAAEPQEVQS